jgi:ATP-dependent Clp protease ATP-binding subunit ClpX
MSQAERSDKPKCSFCGKPPGKGRLLVSGPDGIFICNECVSVCVQVLLEDPRLTLGIIPTEAVDSPVDSEQSPQKEEPEVP